MAKRPVVDDPPGSCGLCSQVCGMFPRHTAEVPEHYVPTGSWCEKASRTLREAKARSGSRPPLSPPGADENSPAVPNPPLE